MTTVRANTCEGSFYALWIAEDGHVYASKLAKYARSPELRSLL